MAGGLEFDAFYDASFRRVVRQVYAMVRSLSEAEDAVQEAYARAWQNWQKISTYGDAEACVASAILESEGPAGEKCYPDGNGPSR